MNARHVWPVLALAVVLNGVSSLVWAQETETVYKCIYSDGRIVFSDQPCANGKMEVQTITAPGAGTGGEAAREGIERLAREYDERREAEREAERRALEKRLSNPDIVVVTPWDSDNDSRYLPRYYPYLYDRYRDPRHGGLKLDQDGFSLWFGNTRPHRPRHDRSRSPDDSKTERAPFSSDGQPIKEPGYSGRYPGGFPGYR
ncbi:DUF4124 domain-containing protein [Guyparkeria sp. 1SP6A2]|nr:DUF4124 domain-containing protein [Guyparkeria sp. 1SP6A2]